MQRRRGEPVILTAEYADCLYAAIEGWSVILTAESAESLNAAQEGNPESEESIHAGDARHNRSCSPAALPLHR
jgi:hypothetical protein